MYEYNIIWYICKCSCYDKRMNRGKDFDLNIMTLAVNRNKGLSCSNKNYIMKSITDVYKRLAEALWEKERRRK